MKTKNMGDWIVEQITKTFITEDRYKLFIQGFTNTMIIVFAAAIIGVILGILVAVVRVSHSQNDKPNFILKLMNKICSFYLAIFRGTPIIVQLMIIYYIVFLNAGIHNRLIAAIVGFGFNSGAYVAEIVRAGIMAVDKGQTEAGRSLGFSSVVTMRLIILPQAIKNILPALGNEFITLIKETAVAGTISVMDFTMAADSVRIRTMDALFPLLFVALVYFIIIWIFTKSLGVLERRMRKGDNR